MTAGAALAPTEIDYWAEDVESKDDESGAASLLERITDVSSSDELDKRLSFELLADELASATLGMSSTRRASVHPAYRDILTWGEAAIPYLVRRLDDEIDRPIWLRVLGSLTSLQPGAGKDTVEEAADAWIRWARARGHSPA